MSGILAALAGIKTAIATAVDEYFNRVTLLLNTSSTNGAQNNTFLDSSSNNFTITRNGNTTQGTFTPFSQTGWSNYFGGSSDYLTLPSNSANFLHTGAADWTFECWFWCTTTGSTQTLLSTAAASSQIGIFLGLNNVSAGGISMAIYRAGANYTFNTNAGVWNTNTFNHVAITYNQSANTYAIYLNGVSQSLTTTGTASYNAGNATYAPAIGRFQDSAPGGYFTGYVSNMRTVNGTRVYTANFTPPTTALTAITNTAFLTCQSNRFIDNSSNAYALTVNGTPSVQAFSPFLPTAAYDTAVVGGSGYFDGSGDYLTVPSNSAFNFNTGDFTLETWVYMPSVSSAQEIFSQGSGTFAGIGVYTTSTGKVHIDLGNGSSWYASAETTNSVKVNSWTHIAIVRQSTTYTIYLNGVSDATTTTATFPSDASGSISYIGIYGPLTSQPFTGYMSGFRIVKGTGGAVYTSNFTPPTAPPTAITNTSLLANFTNAGIYDSASKNVLETVGNAQVSTTQAKWGTTSMYFDGTGDYLAIPSGYNLGFGTGDFTIEGWLYLSATSSYSTIMSNRPNGSDTTTGRWSVAVRSSAFEFYANGSQIISAGTVSTSTWTHFAVTRASGSLRLFLGGTQVGSTTSFTTDLSSLATWVGANGAGTEAINAYIDDLRVTKGYARYTSNFTPATAAFPIQ